jgi:hypothetical protein
MPEYRDPLRLRLVKATNAAAHWLLNHRRFVLANAMWRLCKLVGRIHG